MQNLRVLLVAEAANPEWVSVPLVGWSLATALIERCDAHLVTQVRNRNAIENAGLTHGVDFTALDTEAVDAWVWRASNVLRLGAGRGWTTQAALTALTYPNFERKLLGRFGESIRGGEFDVVHRITPLSPTANGSLAKLCRAVGVPFVVGPLNGGLPWPKGFEQERLKERELLSYVRMGYKLLPYRHQTLRAATAIIAGSRHTLSEIPTEFQEKSFLIPENAIDPRKFPSAQDAQRFQKPVRACFIGRLVPYKGLQILLRAAADMLRKRELCLDVIGSGPQEAELHALAEQLGIANHVTFHGWVAHEDVKTILQQCDILPFPSVREFGGGVVLEAMAMGVVPIVVDYGGPGELVDELTGYKIPLGSRSELELSLRGILGEILSNVAEVQEKSRRAQKRISTYFTWERKADQILDIYSYCLGRAKERPNFQFVAETRGEKMPPEQVG